MAKWIIISLALTLSACSTTGGLFGERSSPASTPTDNEPPAAASMDAQGLTVYLEMMRQLIETDSLTQAVTFSTVEDAADFAPTTTNRLKLALALAVPGHPASDDVLAEQQLSALLSAGDALLPEERVLAVIQLREVEQRLILDASTAQLRSEMESALAEQDADGAQQVQTLLDENRRLRAELEDAMAKLDALTTIEQSIREREDSAN